MNVLLVTGMYPTASRPLNGVVIRKQVQSLERLDVRFDIFHLRPDTGGTVFTRYRELKSLLRKRTYDIIHVHYGFTATLLALLCHGSIPVVATYHGTDINGYPINRFKHLLQKLFFSAIASITRQISRYIDHVIVMNESMKSKLPKVVQEKCTVIPMGVDLSRFFRSNRREARETLGWGNEAVVIYCDNNRDPVKRPDLAFETMKLVKESIPNARFYILRGLPYEKVPVVLSASDCLLVTSDSEGSPNIVREALACDLPIVSVRVGDIPKYLSNVNAGEVIDNQNPKELATAVIKVLRRTERYSLSHIVEKDSLEMVATRVLAVYQSVYTS